MLLYYITDRRAFPGDDVRQRQALFDCVANASAAGVDYIQLREKDLPVPELEALAREVMALVRARSAMTRVLVNQHLEVALAVGADGIHLPGGSVAPSEVRRTWSQACDRVPLIAVSAHTVDEVRHAETQDADFAVLAPIFEKPGTSLQGLGLGVLSEACGCAMVRDDLEGNCRAAFPVFALGGVNLGNAAACLRSGAAGIAGIRLFQVGDLGETVRTLRNLASVPAQRQGCL